MNPFIYRLAIITMLLSCNTIQADDDIDSLLDAAQREGNAHLSTVNKLVASSLETASSKFAEATKITDSPTTGSKKNSVANTYSNVNNPNQQQNPSSTKIYRSAINCIQLEQRLNAALDRFINNCGYNVQIFYADEVNTKKLYHAAILSPMRAVQVHKINGRRTFAACEHPATPYSRSGTTRWQWDQPYICLNK